MKFNSPFALLTAATLAADEAIAETVLGAFIYHRHGDRTSKSTPPTSLTALGADQVFASGSYFRNQFVASNSTSPILGLATDVAVLSQLSVTAPLDNVLQSSANVFTQGLYPPAGNAAVQTLANGQKTQAPFGGYQYIPVNIVTSASSATSSEDSGWLQGNSGCGLAVVSSNNYLLSSDYMNLYNSTTAFYQDLFPVYNSTFAQSAASFKNAYTIYDYIHVAEIHNATIPSSNLLNTDNLHQLQTLADAHEWGLAYNSSEPVRAIAGAVLAAEILSALNTTLSVPPSKKSGQRLTIQFGAYATFMSFFGLAQLDKANANFRGVVDYASAMVFELVTNNTAITNTTTTAVNTSDVSVRFSFVNGTVSATNLPQTFPLFNQAQITLPWMDFVNGIHSFAVGNTSAWCTQCGNTTGVCAPSASSSSGSSGSASGQSSGDSNSNNGGISAGLGAGIGILSFFGFILLLALAAFALGFRCVRHPHRAAGKGVNGGNGGNGVKA